MLIATVSHPADASVSFGAADGAFATPRAVVTRCDGRLGTLGPPSDSPESTFEKRGAAGMLTDACPCDAPYA